MNYFKTTILLGLLAGLMIGAGMLLGGQSGAIIGLVIAIVMNFSAYWFSDKVVLKMFKAKLVDTDSEPDLCHMINDLSMKASIPTPKVYIMENNAPNAFATGRNPEHGAVAFTTGIINMLSKEELMGVAAHELSHIKNRDILISTIAATIAGAISFMAQMAMWANMFGGRDNRGTHPAVLILVMLLAPIAAGIIQMAVSRSREYEADKGGAVICGNPIYLADALGKLANFSNPKMEKVNDATAHMFIVSPLSGGGVKKLFSTHPPLEERIKRLHAMNKLGL